MVPASILRVLVEVDGMTKAHKEVTGLDRGLDKAGKTGDRTTRALKKMGAVVGGIVAFDTLRRGVGFAVDEFEEARKVGAQTEQVIKSTGGAAGVTAKHVAKLASAISKKAGVDDEAIQSGANLLLTFTNIRNEAGRGNKIFDQSTRVITDMSAALGQDMKSSAIQVGKALNDPIKGVTALQRVGVSFTEKQREQIKALTESGHTLKAQKLILRELNKEFGGAAGAKATALDHLKVSVGNLAEAAGAVLVPAFDKAAQFASVLIDQMIEGKSTGGAIISVFRGIGTSVGDVIGWIRSLVGWFKQHETASLALGAALGVILTALAGFAIVAGVTAALEAMAGAVVALNLALAANPIILVVVALAALVAGLVVAYRESETFRKIVDKAWDLLKDVAAWMINAGVDAFNAVKDAVVTAWRAVKTATTDTWNAIKTALSTVWNVIKTLVTTYFDAYKTVILTAWRAVRDTGKAIWDAIKTALSTAWDAIKTAATAAWDGIKTAVLTPVRAARDALKNDIWPAIKNVAKTAWDGLKTMLKNGGDALLDVILWPFKSAVKGVAKFAKLILNVVDKIPGVDMSGAVSSIDKFVQGLAKGGTFQAFAHGGAFARTGGLVSAPITLMGEEAPRHPEFVIPTNPAYRRRARGLLAQAAGAIGFATGGKWSIPELTSLWMQEGGASGIADTMAVISTAESGVAGAYGNQYARNPSGAAGLWQILGQLVPGNLMDAHVNARNAIAKYKLQGLHAWDASRSVWSKFIGERGTAGVLEALNPAKFIKMLPGVGDLPGWLQGMGSSVLGSAKDEIKRLVGIHSTPTGSGITSGTLRILHEIADKFGLSLSSTWRSVQHNAAVGGVPGSLHTHGSMANPGAGDLVGPMRAMQLALQYAVGKYHPKEAMIHDVGSGLHLHLGFFKRGGQYGGLPFLGSFHGGGVASREGLAHVAKGERMTMPGQGGPTVLHAVIDLGRGIQERVRLEFDENGRQTRGVYLQGVVT